MLLQSEYNKKKISAEKAALLVENSCWVDYGMISQMPVLFDKALVPPPNPAIRALVVNYCLRGYPGTFFAQQLPTMVVGPQAELLRNCVQNATFMDSALEVENLKKGVDFARKVTGSENILAFDGAVGGLNVSCALAEQLRAMAPAISEEVDGVLLPKWLAQRGLT